MSVALPQEVLELRRRFGAWDEAIEQAMARGPFQSLSLEGTVRLLNNATLVAAAAGDVFYEPYEPGKVAIVLSGLVRAFLTSADGRQITIKYATPGELFGLPAVVGGPVPASAQAVEDSHVLFFDPATFESVVRSEPDMSWRLAEDLGAEFCDLMIQMGESLFDSVPVRTARHLLSLAVPAPNPGEVWVIRTQSELASAVGTVREVISRTLRGFAADGWIELAGTHLVLKDLPRLKQFATRMSPAV